MSEFTVLLVEDAPETILILRNVLENKELKWLLARNSKEATQILHEKCPHLLIVDISLGPEDNGLDWLKSVRQGPFAHLQAIVMTSSAFKADVEQSIALGVDDYVLKPADYELLTRKIHILRKKLKGRPAYEYEANIGAGAGPSGALEVSLRLNSRVRAISETGLCLSSGISNQAPLTVSDFATDLFGQIEVDNPQRISLMNCESEPRKDGGFLFRNYCQVQGWQEKDFQKIRRWIRAQKLNRSF